MGTNTSIAGWRTPIVTFTTSIISTRTTATRGRSPTLTSTCMSRCGIRIRTCPTCTTGMNTNLITVFER